MKIYGSAEIHAGRMTDEALWALTQKPVRTTTLERIRLFHEADERVQGLPQPLQYGNGLKYVLENISLPVREHDLLLGRVSEEVPDEEGEAFFRKYEANSARPAWIHDGGHRSFWWSDLIEVGLPGLRERAAAELEKRSAENDDPAALTYLQGAVLIYDALLTYGKRYAEAAREAGLEEAADVCLAVTEHEPRTFREGLQAMWLVIVVYCALLAANPTLAFGRMDLLLEKLYERDIVNGTLTEEEARLLILDFYCKNNLIMGRGEHQLSGSDPNVSTGWARCLCYDAPQYLVLAGRRPDGTDIAGDLTRLFAETIVPRFKNPVIVVHYSPDFQTKHPDLWKIFVGKMRQSSSMMVYNEADCISSLLLAGVDPEDAVNFEHYGCNHPCLPGLEVHTEYGGFRLGLIQPLLNYLKACVEEGREPESAEELYEIMRKWVESEVSGLIERTKERRANNMKHPSGWIEVTDCFYRDTIRNAQSFTAGGSKYFCANFHYPSYASFIDCLTAVDELVIRQKKIPLRRLMEVLDANFENAPVEHALCKRVPKLGSDDPRPNTHADKIMRIFTDTVNGLTKEMVDPDEYPRIVIRQSMESDTGHIAAGARLGATPDGRLAGVPLSQNVAPAVGASVNGLTARLSSMASIPFDRICAGAQNVSIQPRAFAGEEGLCKLAAILGGYFDMGGLQVQVSAVDVEQLREAQKNPDAHRDLTVRITGYSAVFVDMVKSAQDDIIRREEMSS